MTDFIKAFKEGQDAAEQAISAKAEIDVVLKSVANALLTATDGKLRIHVSESSSYPAFAALEKISRGLSDAAPAPGMERQKTIRANNPKAIDTDSVAIAKWTRPHQGYPCTIAFNGREIACHDRASLEGALASMLQDAWVGEQLRGLLERPIKSMAITDGDDAPPSQSPNNIG